MSEVTQRRLAAIVSVDVVGYSRLMGADEAGTLATMRAHRGELWNPTIEKFGGRVVGTAGDSLLVEFASAVAAVESSIVVQRGMVERNADLPDDKRMLLRIGINIGEVIIDGDDIFGEGVNIAARMQEVAAPGGIAISRNVQEQVRDKLETVFIDDGAHELKNIAQPVHVWRWPAEGQSSPGPAASAEAKPLPLPDKPSIAVLPFDNMSGDPEQGYFADGIAEDIIASLSRFHWFFVISRNSSFAYKGRATDVKQTARELGVRYVLEGSVRKSGNRVRITAQLIDAVGDRHVWAERFDRVLEDIFAVQDEITQSIVGTVAPEYLSAEMRRARRKEVPRLDAWELAVRAHWHISQFTREDNHEARALLLRAVELDPESSFGLTDLSLTFLAECVYGWGADPKSSIAEAVRTAKRAVAINSRDAYAYALLGAADLYSGHHDDAISNLEQAIALNPNDPHAFAILGRTLIYLGQVGTGLEYVNKAIRLSPRDPMITLWYGILALEAFVSTRYDEAVTWARAAVRVQPNRNIAYLDLAAYRAQLGDSGEAAEALATFQSLTSNVSVAQIARVHPFAREADRERYFEGLRKAGLSE